MGVTWNGADQLADGDITVEVRTETDGAWSPWNLMPYDADHGPDPGSDEARSARPGTDPVVVGDVDKVQVKAVTSVGKSPTDVKLAVIAPGEAASSAVQEPAIDTAAVDSSEGAGGGAAYGTDRVHRRSRSAWSPTSPGSSRVPNGEPTRASATRGRCTTSRCTPASSTTR